MGCCQGRDEKLLFKPPAAKINSPKPMLDNNSNNLPPDPSISPPPLDLALLKPYLEKLSSLKQWERLVSLIKDPTPIQEGKFRLKWANPPRTIGSYVLVFLCKIFMKHPSETPNEEIEEILPFLQSLLPTIVECVNSGSDDRKDNSLLLLYYILSITRDQDVQQLMNLNIFGILMRTMMCSKQELRHLTAGVCCQLYKGRLEVRRLFISMNGGKYLIQQIKWSSENPEILKTLLEYLLDLVEDEEGRPDALIVNKLNEENAKDIIRDINSVDNEMEVIDLMDQILTSLAYEDDY